MANRPNAIILKIYCRQPNGIAACTFTIQTPQATEQKTNNDTL